jgi:malonyl-CoA O-methyltransferase
MTERLAPLPAREAYRLWAPHYASENAVTALEQVAVLGVTGELQGRSLLDVGCGTGRRLPRAAHRLKRCAGVDLVLDMLLAGLAGRDDVGDACHLLNADLLRLPLRAGIFDTVWCRLVLGHLQSLPAAYRELARVATSGARLVVTDFHPAAAAAGHTRTFRAADGRLRAVEHHSHSAQAHAAAASAAEWRLLEQRDLLVGPAVRSFYEQANALDRYRAQQGMPLVLLLSFQR